MLLVPRHPSTCCSGRAPLSSTLLAGVVIVHIEELLPQLAHGAVQPPAAARGQARSSGGAQLQPLMAARQKGCSGSCGGHRGHQAACAQPLCVAQRALAVRAVGGVLAVAVVDLRAEAY